MVHSKCSAIFIIFCSFTIKVCVNVRAFGQVVNISNAEFVVSGCLIEATAIANHMGVECVSVCHQIHAFLPDIDLTVIGIGTHYRRRADAVR